MAPPRKDYCCCCIPLRGAVFLISLIALIIGGLNLWSVIRVGASNSSYSTSKVGGYIAAGVYGIIGICGILSALIKTYALAKNFSVLWWTVTIIATILAVINLVLLATRDKDGLQVICRYDLLNDPSNTYTSDVDLENDVQKCHNMYLIVAGISLAVQVLIMSLCGWVASRYTSEVKHMHDNQYMDQAPAQVQVHQQESYHQDTQTQYKS